VVDLGLLPTPMIYYAQRRLGAAGCAIVTASHNPPAMNGLKWMLGDRPPMPEDVAALGQAVQTKEEGGRGRGRNAVVSGQWSVVSAGLQATHR